VNQAPSGAAMELCQAIVASLQMCLGVTVPTTGCLQSVKVFSDAALLRAKSCENESCNERVQCLTAELGTDPTQPDAQPLQPRQ
jgi:hypothetical protein